jgi:uncharacterized protein (TIGR03437 family)
MTTFRRLNIAFFRIPGRHRRFKLMALALSLTIGLISSLILSGPSETAATEAIIRTPAGSGFFGFSGDNGLATNARFSTPNGVAVDAKGNFYIADMFNDRIRKVDSNGIITTIAGRFGGTFGGDGGPATEAGLFDPAGVAVDAIGNVYIADMDNFRIRKVDPGGKISTVAGNGAFGFTGDNVPATQTALSSPTAVAIDSAGNLYIADLFNRRVRQVNPQGIITTVTGTGQAGYDGDGGPATQARIESPESLALDRLGNLYIADSANNVVRKVDTVGMISTFAGTGQGGFSGDNGQARQARLNSPRGVAVDMAGKVYISDAGNDRIRQVDTNGIITTIAGNGQTGYNGDGMLAFQASFFEPVGLTVDPYGVIYIADSYNDRIRMLKSTQLQLAGLSQYVLPAGGTGASLQIIGTGLEDTSVVLNGQNTSASLDQATGNLVISIPAPMLAAPGALSIQANKMTGQASGERKVIVAAQAQLNAVAGVTVSAASYQPVAAPEAIAAMFGTLLATQFSPASSIPLPTFIAGTTVYANGIASPLFLVSPNQINYQIPQGLAPGGIATIVTVAGDGAVSQGQFQVGAEAPGIFTANASGSGGPAALWTLDGVSYMAVTSSDGTLSVLPAGAFVVLFATGIRGAYSLNPSDGNGVAESVRVNLGGEIVTPLYAGPQDGFVGLDQINLQLPAGLAGRGKIDVVLTVHGRAANTIQLQVM